MIFLVNQLAFISLILLNLIWELFFTINGEPSWLVIKSLILIIPLANILKKKVYTIHWVNFVIILFFIEGVVRCWSETSPSNIFALAEVLLTLIFFFSSVLIFKK